MQAGEHLSISRLAILSGFKIPAQRFQILLPQLDWIMKESELLDSITFAGIEPANVYSPLMYFSGEDESNDEYR